MSELDNVKSKVVKVKKTSDIIGKIIDELDYLPKMVLKIDTEGSEYDIIDDLIDSGIIYNIDLILGEGHRFNNRDVSLMLERIGFKKIFWIIKLILIN